MAERDDLAFEHDIELPVQPDPEDDQDRFYRAPSPEYQRRPWARALNAVLEEPMVAPPKYLKTDFYRAVVGETWQQRGEECTGFALAAIANFHLRVERIYRTVVDEVIKSILHDTFDKINEKHLEDHQNVEHFEDYQRAKNEIVAVFKGAAEDGRGRGEAMPLDVWLRKSLYGRLGDKTVDAVADELAGWFVDDPPTVDELKNEATAQLRLHGRDHWWELRAAATKMYTYLRQSPPPGAEGRPSLTEALKTDLGHPLAAPRQKWAEYTLAAFRALKESFLADPEMVVSRRMLYEMAQRYDRETYVEGSTLRGALRGWDALGVAADKDWKYTAGDEFGKVEGDIGLTRMLAAVRRPGGYYFRLDPRDLGAMKAALARGGGTYPLYCSARLHAGWYRLFLPKAGDDPVIRQTHGDASEGYHAFVVAGYDDRDGRDGFWVHNSWGEQWGARGYGLLPYEDWLRNCGDAWVVIPRPSPKLVDREQLNTYVVESDVSLRKKDKDPEKTSPEMWPHLVPIGDDGRLVSDAPYGIDKSLIKTLLYLFQEDTSADFVPRLLIFADGGYLPREYTVPMLASIRARLANKRIFPIFLVWDTEWWTLTRTWIDQLTSAKVESAGGWGYDPTSPEVQEIVAESFAPRVWNEVKRRARLAVDLDDGAARLLASAVTYKWGQQRKRGRPFQIHLVSHGAGDILMAELAQLLPAPITSCTAWAPAITLRRFDATYRPMLDDGRLQHMSIFALDEGHEATYGVQNVLHLISNILEFDWPWKAREAAFGKDASPHRPKPLLGMPRYLVTDDTIGRLRDEGKLDVQIMRYPRHDLLVADAAGMQSIDYESDDTGTRMLKRTIEHITSFTDPPGPWRPARTAARMAAPAGTGDPLVRARALASLGRSAPPGGARG